MNANEVFTSNYLKATDLGDNKPIVAIAGVEMQTLGQGEEAETKPVVSFVGKEKGLVCNKTNWNTLIDLFGAETDDWAGKKIRLCATEVAFKGKMTMAVRISPVKIVSNDVLTGPIKPKAAPVAATEEVSDDSF